MPEDEQPAEQPPHTQVGIKMIPDGLMFTVTPAPINVMVGPDVLTQIAVQVVANTPALADEIVKQRVQFLRNERNRLALMKDIVRSKNN